MEKEINEIRKILDKMEAIENKRKTKKKSNIITLEKEKLMVICNGKSEKLTRSEFLILNELVYADNNFCTYEHLCKILYDYQVDEFTTKSLRITICRLRKKLKGISDIRSIHAKGYELVKGKTR